MTGDLGLGPSVGSGEAVVIGGETCLTGVGTRRIGATQSSCASADHEQPLVDWGEALRSTLTSLTLNRSRAAPRQSIGGGASIEARPVHIPAMRGQDKYDAMVRREYSALRAIGKAARQLKRSRERRLRRAGRAGPPSAPLTVVRTAPDEFAEADSWGRVDARSEQAVVSELVAAGNFIGRTPCNHGVIVAPPHVRMPLPGGVGGAVALLRASEPLPLWGGESTLICVVRTMPSDKMPNLFTLVAGEDEAAPEAHLKVCRRTFEAMQRVVAKMLGAQLLEESE